MKLDTGFYQPSQAFLAIAEHTAVMDARTQALIAVAGHVHCDHCEEFWNTISDYHADRTAATPAPNQPAEPAPWEQEAPKTNGPFPKTLTTANIYSRFYRIVHRTTTEQLVELDAWMDDVEQQLFATEATV